MGPHKTLSEIFSQVNLRELPAMSDHFQELLRLLSRDDAGAGEIAEVILKDSPPLASPP